MRSALLTLAQGEDPIPDRNEPLPDPGWMLASESRRKFLEAQLRVIELRTRLGLWPVIGVRHA